MRFGDRSVHRSVHRSDQAQQHRPGHRSGLRPTGGRAPLPAVALCALVCAPLAHAEPQAGDDRSGIDRTIVVTATREPQAAADVLSPLVVIDRETLERSLAPDVADVLRLHAGLEVVRTGGPGQQTALFMRGTDSNHALVLVDGVRVNPGGIGGAALQNIAPELVERIEVVKGPRSTLYGTDAIGGVVNVITRRESGDALQALVGYGRYGTRQAQVSGSLDGDLGQLSLAANSLSSDGFPTFTGDTVDRGYRNHSFAASARTELAGVELGVRGWRAAGNTQYSDFFRTPVDQDFENSAAALEAGGQVGEAWHTRVTLSRITDDQRQRQSPDYAITNRTSVDWQNGVVAGRHALTFGALLTRDHTRAETFGEGYDVRTDANTFYAQDQLAFGANRLLLAAGFTHHDSFGGHATWNAEYGHALGPDTRLTLSAGTAFRAPDATDRFGFGGNPQLDPERSRNLELGLRHRIGAHHVLSLSAFDNRIDDLIQFVTLSFDPFEGRNLNVDRARIRGVEASWDYAVDDWSARVEAIRQDPIDRADGSRLLRRARTSGTLALTRRVGAHEFGVDVLAAGAREDFGFPERVRLGGYALANLSARFTLARQWTLQFRLENALDRRYELASTYNTMRRALMVATRYQFR